MFNLTADALKWLSDRLRPRWFWVGVLALSVLFSLWNSIPDKYQTKILDFAMEHISGPSERFDLEVAEFEIEGADETFLVWLKNKVERNLVELFVDHNHRTAHRLAILKPEGRARRKIEGVVSTTGDSSSAGEETVEISMRMVGEDGSVLASTTLSAPREFLKDNYKVLPETLVYGLDIGLDSLKPLDSKARPTKSLRAYALYIHAKYRAERQEFEKALALLDAALKEDPSFATAHWAAAQILRETGDEEGAASRLKQADAINPDHYKGVFLSGVSKPLPEVLKRLSGIGWEQVGEGLYMRTAELPGYGIELFFWKFDPSRFRMRLALQESQQGSTVRDLMDKGSAVLGTNGGFFEIDRASRLSPSGLLVSDGKKIADYRKGAGSALLYEKGGRIGIGWSKDWEEVGDAANVVQAGPMIVDPGGKNGILKNNFNRHNRTAVCITNNGYAVVSIVKGGLSLFELGAILSLPDSDGGFSCERAINLDGGPSTQAYFRSKDAKHTTDVKGTWTTQNAVLIEPK